VQALPPPFSPGAPQFAPQGSPRRRRRPGAGILSLGAGEPTSQVVFQAQTWPLETRLVAFSGRLGAMEPGQLIKVATCQIRRHPYGMRPAHQWRHLCLTTP
jgi:hypothetical protein